MDAKLIKCGKYYSIQYTDREIIKFKNTLCTDRKSALERMNSFIRYKLNEISLKKDIRNKNNTRNLTLSLRQKILRRDGFRCVMCGMSASDGTTLHVDHKKPLSLGGETKEYNLWTLCKECNLGKSDRYDDSNLVLPLSEADKGN